jgi:hypothetical protein
MAAIRSRMATTLATPSVLSSDVVQIDQSQAADTGPRQRFHRPGPDAADADHHHMRRCGTSERAGPVEPVDAAKAAREIGMIVHGAG